MNRDRTVRSRWKASAVSALGALLLGCGNGTDAPETARTAPGRGQIHEERLRRVAEEPESWLTTGRDFGKTHFSPLKAINWSNVHTLGFAWEYRTDTNRGLEASPIVVDGVLFTSGQAGKVYALDAATGEALWTFDPRVDGQIYRVTCCDGVNRGVAVRNGRVYVAALDGRLFALDAEDGAVVWEADTVIDKTRGYTSTGAPEIAGDVVVIGNAGAEFDARGYISAYSLESGELAWRFFTVPGDPAKPYEHIELEWAAKTWDPNSLWRAGLGGTAWDALVYDPELDLLYVGTGNAAVYSRRDRSPSGGDNLFLTSILAIDPDTGRLVWHYQQVPGDQWDYTATQPIVLADLEIGGQLRKVLMQAPKNGFFYVLDRETGEFISAGNYVPVNWGTIDPVTGKATVDTKVADYSDGVKLVFPSTAGGHSWHPMSFNPKSGLVYLSVLEMGNYIFDAVPGHKYRPGERNIGTQVIFAGAALGASDYPKEVAATIESNVLLAGQPDPTPRAFLRAWDPVAQSKVWDVELTAFWDRAGVLSTGGGLVIQGTGTGFLRVYDAFDGTMLQEIHVGSSIVAAPISYAVDGEQHIAVMAAIGGAPLSYAPPPGSAAFEYGNAGRVLAFKLGGGATPLPPPLPPIDPIPKPPALTASRESIEHGAKLYGAYCRSCHRNSPRGVAPDLRRVTNRDLFRAVVLDGAYRSRGMPRWDDLLSAEDVDAIQAYVISEAHAAYAAENQVDLGDSVGSSAAAHERPEPDRDAPRQRSESRGADPAQNR